LIRLLTKKGKTPPEKSVWLGVLSQIDRFKKRGEEFEKHGRETPHPSERKTGSKKQAAAKLPPEEGMKPKKDSGG